MSVQVAEGAECPVRVCAVGSYSFLMNWMHA